MRDIKTWLQQTGMKAAEGFFKLPPKPPYLVYLEERTVEGADFKNLYASRQLTVELYADAPDAAAEETLEQLLDAEGIHYDKTGVWLGTEKFWLTTYLFNLLETL